MVPLTSFPFPFPFWGKTVSWPLSPLTLQPFYKILCPLRQGRNHSCLVLEEEETENQLPKLSTQIKINACNE